MKSKCGNKTEEENNVNYNSMKRSINYQECEELASKSKDLYNQALSYNKAIEMYSAMAAQAECKARQLEEQVQVECKTIKLEEQIQDAWWEYNEFIQRSNIAACKAESLMKASCKLLQKSQECYTHLHSNKNIYSCNKHN
ncbi:hypothetical protein [Romboutsia sp.]|uniref:hypothetical protein n=1 Tax=Romboutsia sp. TaxID=1965302 RepID=UPI003F3B497E